MCAATAPTETIRASPDGNLTARQQLERISLLVQELTDSSKREAALSELSKRREAFPELAPILWHSYGSVAALLQEIVATYPVLSPPTLSSSASNRVCNSLALLQCVASHTETRALFLRAHIPLFLYPFLNTVSKSRPFEYLRLTSLGVIGALVKVDDPDVVSFLLQTEIIPLCLRIMETGSELSKTVATFVIQKILLDDVGLTYICATAERFYAVSTVLSHLVLALVEVQAPRLLKHVVRCYLRLSENMRAREALRQCLPDQLRDMAHNPSFAEDVTVKRWLNALLFNVSSVEPTAGRGADPGPQLSHNGPSLTGQPGAAGQAAHFSGGVGPEVGFSLQGGRPPMPAPPGQLGGGQLGGGQLGGHTGLPAF
jgi:CCR4-NOT transcription complex subunit 9